jgi:hypothetical protein
VDDWLDPLSEDEEAARERTRRRAERARRRAERDVAAESEPPPEVSDARRALGDRVRDGLGDGAGSGAEAHDADPLGRDGEAPAATSGGNGARGDRPQLASPLPPEARPDPPQGRQPLGPSRGRVWMRRLIAVLGIACLAFVAVVVLVIAQRGDGDGEEAAPPAAAKPLRTFDLTIPEGYDRSQTAAVAREAGVEGNYMAASRNAPRGFNLAEYEARGADSLEGFLFPATYELFRSDRAEDLVQKQIEAFEQNFASIDMGYADSRNLTPYDVVKIASMIEREVVEEEERSLVSAVIYNRLSQGMPLQIDATIRFEDQNYDEPLLASRLDEDTPYNTYTNTGLPPGPIGNPGAASLEAAADPERVNYLYYVVDPGTCGHVFTASEAEFLDAKAEYEAARAAEGGQSPTEC